MNQTIGLITLVVDEYEPAIDFYRDYEAYQSKGIVFVRPPKKERYGTVAVFKDLYGNLCDLIQATGSTGLDLKKQ